jgi:ABC-2 type transport system ATP-binding protein
VTFHVDSGEAFVPRLFAELDVAVTSVAVSRPTLDDVFMRYTGSTIRDAETASGSDRNRAIIRVLARTGR